MSYAITPRLHGLALGFSGAPRGMGQFVVGAPSGGATTLPGAGGGILGVDPLAFLTNAGTTNAGALGQAVQGVVGDSSLLSGLTTAGLPILSPFSHINLAALQTTIESYVGQAITAAASTIIAALPNEVMSVVTSVMGAIGQVADLVPIVGQVVNFFIGIAELFSSGPTDAERAQWQGAQCQMFLDAYSIEKVATGGALDPCTVCPSDYFYPSIVDQVNFMTCASPYRSEASLKAAGLNVSSAADSHVQPGSGCNPATTPCDPGGVVGGNMWMPADTARWTGRAGPECQATWAWRPAIGMALMRITEGVYYDGFEIADPAKRSAYSKSTSVALKKTLEAYAADQAKAYNFVPTTLLANGALGIPGPRRAQFRALRRAIQAASKNYGVVSDAGVSLWPIYMDLLLEAYENGWMTDDLAAYLLRYNYFADYDQVLDATWFGPGIYKAGSIGHGIGNNGPGDDHGSNACPQALANQIGQMAARWKNTTQAPATVAGAQKLASYVAQAQSVAAQVAGSARRTSFGGKSKSYSSAPLKTTPWGFLVKPPVAVPVQTTHPGMALVGAAAAAGIIWLFL